MVPDTEGLVQLLLNRMEGPTSNWMLLTFKFKFEVPYPS